MPRVDHLTIEQGATYEMSWPLFNPSTGEPFDSLDGWSARAQARMAVAQPLVLFEWSSSPTGNQGTILLEDSTLKFQVSADESSQWSWRKAAYDIELVS